VGTQLRHYIDQVPIDGVGLDWTIDRIVARNWIGERIAVQGNLDPLVLLAGGAALERAVDDVLAGFAGMPFIFNLGHGILPQTPIPHVERMLKRVRGN
jgi:uroporphyrinogen decarboxylase